MLRFLFQLGRGNFYHPIVKFVITVTNPVVFPARRIIPGYFKIDFATVTLIFLVKMIEITLSMAIYSNEFITNASVTTLLGLSLMSVGQILGLTITLYTYVIIILAILSWIRPMELNNNLSPLITITEPVLQPIRRKIKPIHGLDISPLVFIVILQFLQRLVCAPLVHFGSLYLMT